MSQFIFWISSFLTEDRTSGLISIGILIWLLIEMVMVVISANRKINALSWLEDQVRQAMNKEEFAAQAALHGPDRGAELRHSLEARLGAIKGNPNMTQREKFCCEKTLEDAIDTIDQLRAKASWSK